MSLMGKLGMSLLKVLGVLLMAVFEGGGLALRGGFRRIVMVFGHCNGLLHSSIFALSDFGCV